MTTTKMSTWQTNHGEVTASPDILRRLFNAKQATDFEVFHFIQLCRAQRLNPFMRDAYLIKYGSSPATIVTGKETFTQRAESHPDYDGMEAGVIVMRGDDPSPSYLVGTFTLPTDDLVGAWCRVHRKSWGAALEKSVSRAEYDTGRSLWESKPATMLEKVAIVQALREAFPRTFAGLYDHAEIGADLPVIEVSDGADDMPAEDTGKGDAPQSGPTPFQILQARIIEELGLDQESVWPVLAEALEIGPNDTWQSRVGGDTDEEIEEAVRRVTGYLQEVKDAAADDPADNNR